MNVLRTNDAFMLRLSLTPPLMYFKGKQKITKEHWKDLDIILDNLLLKSEAI